MASLDMLDEAQKGILGQFQSITQTEDLERSVDILAQHKWNLEPAVQQFYDGTAHTATNEPPDDERLLSSSDDGIRHRSTTANGGTSSTNSIDQAAVDSHTSRQQQQQQQKSFLLSFLMWPFGFAWSITWTILSLATRLISHPSIATQTDRSQRRDPRALASQFLREFREYYGDRHVEFFQGGYSEALEKARRELRYLVIILQSDEHDDTEKFCRYVLFVIQVERHLTFVRETLVSTELIEFMDNNNVLIWGGNVREVESHQGKCPHYISCTLQATTYPFTAIIILQTPVGSTVPKMTVVDRIEGSVSPSVLINRFEAAKQRHGHALNRLKLEQEQREIERHLRSEQDKAYRESLKADQEKVTERKAREEREAAVRAEEKAKQAEEERQTYAEKRQQYIRYLYNSLPEEPGSDYVGKVAKLSFRLGNGDRAIRSFRGDQSIEDLYHFIEVYPLLKGDERMDCTSPPEKYKHKFNFTIIAPYPRKTFDVSSKHKLCDEPSLWPSANLIVDTEMDDDE
ncbi:hypothetical protein DFQ30_009222 [Apophysomyces sp. BC1015]|nr:hypothetical protein DFQ30_009222 [Apophysomyces sp. BC1015]